MAETLLSHIERGCTRKRVYGSKPEAKAAAKRFRRITGRKQWVYECPWCGKWHTTTKKQHQRDDE